MIQEFSRHLKDIDNDVSKKHHIESILDCLQTCLYSLINQLKTFKEILTENIKDNLNDKDLNTLLIKYENNSLSKICQSRIKQILNHKNTDEKSCKLFEHARDFLKEYLKIQGKNVNCLFFFLFFFFHV